MGVARLTAERGTCSRLHVGAVIAANHRIISSGYNGAPAGLAHCSHPLGEEVVTSCKRAVHAEANAIAFAARRTSSTEGGELYVTHQPCIDCAKLIINSGIVSVTWAEPYRLLEGVKLLQEAQIKLYVMRPMARDRSEYSVVT